MSLSRRLREAAESASNVRRQEISAALGGTRRDEGIAEQVLAGVHELLLRHMGDRLFSGDGDSGELEAKIFEIVQIYLNERQLPLSQVERARITQEVLDNILRHGPIESLLRDPTVSEVMVTKFDEIYIEQRGKILKTSLSFANDIELRRTIDRIVARVGRRVDEGSPMVDARLPDGSRVNAIIPPIAIDGAALTIRKFPSERLGVADLVALGTITTEAANFLERAVSKRLSVLVSGGTGSGKTTLLNALSSFIEASERIITIEDAAELQLNQPHVVRLEARPPNVEGRGEVTIRELVRNSLRMRPDRIIIGEVRDAAALDMLQAMNTGHEGSLTTVHANSAMDALSRLETMVLMAGMDLPLSVIRDQIARAVDLVVHQERLPSGARHVTEIAQIVEHENGRTHAELLFHFEDNVLRRTPVAPRRRVAEVFL